jgi:hypothetical protein
MENDDRGLRDLLKEWKAPATPPALERRVLVLTGGRTRWWAYLWRGSIRVPVPVACCLATVMVALMVFAGVEFTRHPAPASPCVAVKTAPVEKPGKPFICRVTQACA